LELTSVRVDIPEAGRVRLAGEIVYDDRTGRDEYWFEFPELYADSLSDSGNPWLAALLPLAARLNEPLRLCRPVDAVLAANASRLTAIWRRWNPELGVVTIEAEEQRGDSAPAPSKTAALFSGGVDSFFTVIRNTEPTDRSLFPSIDWLISVWGFDLRLEDDYARLRSRRALAAHELGKEFVDVKTNLRQTRSREASWGHIAHGCFLASIGLALERSVGAVYIAATHSTSSVVPWGSHPETDPLLSTRRTRVIHDGADAGRSAKTEYISRSSVAMRSLHVCFRSRSTENCCRCRKCLLTMMTLELCGALATCEAFPERRLDPKRIEKIFIDSPINEVIFRDLESRAGRDGRTDLARALGRSRKRSRRLRRVMRGLEWLDTKRAFWRIARAVRPMVLARAIR
jgi:hypothetical protein